MRGERKKEEESVELIRRAEWGVWGGGGVDSLRLW